MLLAVSKKPLVALKAAPLNVPKVVKLPAVTLPVAEISPVTYSPVVANTATLLVPAMVTVALALLLAMAMLLVPLAI
jgi:hypothetical protein